MSHRDVPKSGYIDNWKPIPFKKISNEGELADFLSSDICKRICSSKLKKIIDQNHTADDIPIQWLPVTITKEENGETFEYFYLHFPEVCDSLDEEYSLFNRLGVPERIGFSFSKIENKSICNCKGSSTLIMSKDLRKAILDAGCTGLKFEQTIVLEEYNEDKSSSDKIVNL
jgi:hypothetical protein